MRETTRRRMDEVLETLQQSEDPIPAHRLAVMHNTSTRTIIRWMQDPYMTDKCKGLPGHGYILRDRAVPFLYRMDYAPKRRISPKLRKRFNGCEPLIARSASSLVQQLVEVIRDEGYSHKSICEAAGVHSQYITHIAAGIRTPNVMNVEAIAEVLGYGVQLVPIEVDEEDE